MTITILTGGMMNKKIKILEEALEKKAKASGMYFGGKELLPGFIRYVKGKEKITPYHIDIYLLSFKHRVEEAEIEEELSQL